MGQKAQFERFCIDIIKRPDILADKRGASFPTIGPEGVDLLLGETGPQTPDDRDWLVGEIAGEIVKQPRQHCLDACNAHSVPVVPCSIYLDVGDLNGTVGKHLQANGYLQRLEHWDLGAITVVGQPAKYEGTPNLPVAGSWHAPDLGEYNVEVLRSLGFADQEVKELLAVH